jgi:hypothetical protein
VEPENEKVYFLLDVASRTVTLVDTEGRTFCRLQPEAYRRLVRLGTIQESWFPWVYRVSQDLVEGLELEIGKSCRLPDGRRGVGVSARSELYERLLAEYCLDPELRADWYFQWGTVYLDFWGTGEPAADRAQEERLRLYGKLNGTGTMTERFTFLTRERTIRIERKAPLTEKDFSIPIDFLEKTEPQLSLEEWMRRLERWLWPKEGLERP